MSRFGDRVAVPALLTSLLVVVFSSAQSSTFGLSARSRPAAVSPPPVPSRSAVLRPGRALVGDLVVLGDSVAAGSGCGCPPYAALLDRRLSARSGVAIPLANEGTNGLTSAGLLRLLASTGVQEALRNASVVTVTIGANDFDAGTAADPACANVDSCYAAPLAAMSAQVRAALRAIAQFTPPSVRVLVTGYWNVFLDGDVGRAQGGSYVASSDALTRRVNSALQADAVSAHDVYVDEYGPFERQSLPALTALLAPDGDHPSAAGHALIANLLLAALSRR